MKKGGGGGEEGGGEEGENDYHCELLKCVCCCLFLSLIVSFVLCLSVARIVVVLRSLCVLLVSLQRVVSLVLSRSLSRFTATECDHTAHDSSIQQQQHTEVDNEYQCVCC